MVVNNLVWNRLESRSIRIIEPTGWSFILEFGPSGLAATFGQLSVRLLTAP